MVIIFLSGCSNVNISSNNVGVSTQLDADYLIAQFEEKLMSSWKDTGKPVCVTKTLWQQEVGQNQLIVYAASTCMGVVIKNNDLYSGSGQGV